MADKKTYHYHHDGTVDVLECPGCKQEMLLGRHDAANGHDARGEDHGPAYWAGYRAELAHRKLKQ